MNLNTDCWLLILQHIPPGERSPLRLVNHQWCSLIDYLAFSQKGLQFYSAEADHHPKASDRLDVFHWPHQNISYSEFVKIFQQYPNLRKLIFSGFTHWNDHHLIRLTELCRAIESLAFYSCPHLGENYLNDFGFQNLTQIGWQNLAHRYTGLTTLILEDCDLENYHLELIVESFRSLRHLNIANNSEINHFAPLSRLSPTVEILKLGPKLSVDCKKNRALYNHEMPVDAIVGGTAVNIRTLQLQGCLTPKLSRLQHLAHLEHLVIKYASFSSVEDIFSLEVEILTSAAAKVKQLKQLELYQVNQSSSIDLHWLRQRLSSVAISSTLKSSLPSLVSFSLHSTSPLIVVDQFRLVDYILASTPNLSTFTLSCATFDPNLHYNLNQTILVLLQKYGTKLTAIKLENLFPTGLYSYLAYVILTSPRLLQFTMDDRELATFLYCLDMQLDQLLANDKLARPLDTPLELNFTTSHAPSRLEYNQHQVANSQFHYLPDFTNISFTTEEEAEHRLKVVDMSAADTVLDSLYSTQENDLSDLCLLIDCSCDLIGTVVDIVSLCSNYLCLSVACLMFLRPSHLLRWLLKVWRLK